MHAGLLWCLPPYSLNLCLNSCKSWISGECWLKGRQGSECQAVLFPATDLRGLRSTTVSCSGWPNSIALTMGFQGFNLVSQRCWLESSSAAVSSVWNSFAIVLARDWGGNLAAFLGHTAVESSKQKRKSANQPKGANRPVSPPIVSSGTFTETNSVYHFLAFIGHIHKAGMCKVWGGKSRASFGC